MAFQAFQQYLQSEQLPVSIQSHALVLQNLIGEMLDSGFSDITLNNYFQYLILTPQINQSSFSAINSIILAKIHEMAIQKVINTDAYLKLISLMEYIKENESDLSALSIEMFKYYLWNQNITLPKDANIDTTILDLEDKLALIKHKYKISTVADLIMHIRGVKTERSEYVTGEKGVDYQAIVARLLQLGFLDRVEAGFLLSLIYRYQIIPINQLLGENLSTEYPELSLFDLGMQPRYYNPLNRFGFRTIGELKWELLNGMVPFPVEGLGPKSIIVMTNALVYKGYLTENQKTQIFNRYEINIEEES